MATQKELLFLAHRIPYPPNKGDKIRSFNLLKHLAQNYRVHVGAFVDDPHDWRYRADLQAMCDELCLLDLHPLRRRVASLQGLLTGQPLTLPYYAHPGMQRWVNQLLVRRPIDAVVVFSSPMAQYAETHIGAARRRVVDFVDVDSDKWAQYARAKTWPVSWIYNREARTLLRYERKIASEFDAAVFVSEHESALFKQLAPEVAERSFGISNGVDTDYFSPERDYPNPYEHSGQVLVFTGAMDYWANVDAVRWFAEEIFPDIRLRVPGVTFYIVGARPTPQVQELAKHPGVVVTGAVKDIRPYLAHAVAAVAPMRIARGIQNKVLEAMAMGRPVLATPEAAEGINARHSVELLVASEVASLQNHAVRLLRDGVEELARAARQCVLKQYGWQENLRRFDELLDGNIAAVNTAGEPMTRVAT